MRRMLAVLFAALAAICSGTLPAAAEGSLPGDSVYRFDPVMSDQSGATFHLGQRRGRPLLVAMFYTSCRYVCPLIIDSAKGVEHALSAAERDRLGILLVSLDPARDDTAALKIVFDKRKLDAARWTLARTDDSNVRTLAALLGVRYRALADGEFNHTSALVLLDSEGRRIASSEALGATPDEKFLAAVRETLQTPMK